MEKWFSIENGSIGVQSVLLGPTKIIYGIKNVGHAILAVLLSRWLCFCPVSDLNFISFGFSRFFSLFIAPCHAWTLICVYLSTVAIFPHFSWLRSSFFPSSCPSGRAKSCSHSVFDIIRRQRAGAEKKTNWRTILMNDDWVRAWNSPKIHYFLVCFCCA